MFEKWFNKLEKRVTGISDSDYKPGMFSLERVLIGISYAYGFGVRFRLWLYNMGIFKQKILPCFVISVGNIVAGGTGKTPMAIYVAGILKQMGKQPAVISRGYKGKYKDSSLIVSDGTRIFSDVEESGDEPYMMARRRSFPVVVGKDRFKAGMKAIKTFNCDVIVLDDGFQHLQLKRDLDFLLLDYSNPLGNGRFLPAGRLREPLRISAKRADALIFTRSPDKVDSHENIDKVLCHYPDCPWFKAFHRPFILKQIPDNGNSKEDRANISGLRGKRAVLFSGLAKNASFYQTMKEWGINVLDHLEFKDHYRYKESDILMINDTVKKCQADIILTTEKDWAKLDSNIEWNKDLVVVGIHIQFQDPEGFRSFLNLKLNSR